VRRSADPFARLVTGAATIWLCGQAVINIGYVSGLLPVTGIPLPLISAGGTSLLVTFFVLGMLTSFARHETDAVTSARKAERLGRRSRTERWARIPVPRAYAPPKRRSAPASATRPAARAAGERSAAPRAARRR
jgi:cell division protein FtsW